MTYKITVEEIGPASEGSNYPSRETIYEQRVDDLDLKALIHAVNITK